MFVYELSGSEFESSCSHLFNLMLSTNETHLGIRLVRVNVGCMQAFVMIDVETVINADMNVKKIIEKGRWDGRFIWNNSTCECERDKCDVSEYLDNVISKCRKSFFDTLFEIVKIL